MPDGMQSAHGAGTDAVIAQQRRREIRRRLATAGFVGTRDLASELRVNVSTIRRDLDGLARAGLVLRTHGGAVLAPHPASDQLVDLPYAMKENERVAQKQAIGAFAAGLLRQRRNCCAERLAVFMNVTPEFASSTGHRSPAEIAKTVATSSLPDAILVSGPMAGAQPDASTLSQVRQAVPAELPVLLNTGAKAENIAGFLEVADGCIVGSGLKVDGYTWNPVDPDRAAAFVKAARGG